MKYRVLRQFVGEQAYILIGHYELKMQASAAIREDQMNHPAQAKELTYQIDPVEIEMTQAEIDEFMKVHKHGRT